jgi:transcriptional regulator GlxA family with amidase domain
VRHNLGRYDVSGELPWLIVQARDIIILEVNVRLAATLRQMHDRPTWPWTVSELAKEAALSRSLFFERFKRALGVTPMEYLLHWRMALAKDLLRRKIVGVAEVAQRVGYSSARTFSVAFTRPVGLPPIAYARQHAAA